MRVVDQLGREIRISTTPKRIVSLVPSQTELLVDLGLQSNLIGITKFCVHPVELRNEITVVGGTKNIRFEKIKNLSPDIIICNKEENTQDIVKSCETIAPVWVSDISNFDEALQMIVLLGELFQKQAKAREIISGIIRAKKKFTSSQVIGTNLKVIYLIWQRPYMAAGRQTFINTLLNLNGFINVVTQNRYPEVTTSQFEECDIVLLSSEPFPFNETHAKEVQHITKKPVLVVDGEYFSWYGSRLAEAFPYFNSLQRKLSELF